MEIYSFRSGVTPLLISIPHNGSFIPGAIAKSMSEAGRESKDTDWFLDRLYEVSQAQSASLLVANVSRYVIDLNRPQLDESLYPGHATTGLIPKQRFDGQLIYSDTEPSQAEIQRRIETYWEPYHQKLGQELNRLTQTHGFAMLLEAHSIASVVPRLFEGTLPDFNLGTNRGASCNNSLLEQVENVLVNQSRYTWVSNERFIGGHITRHFGQPENNWHALQIELSQATYMDEQKSSWNESKAADIQTMLNQLLEVMNHWSPPK